MALQGGGQMLVWGWVGQAVMGHGKEFRLDSVGGLEATVGFRLGKDMTDWV